MFLGIDLGTSGVKVLLMDADQSVLGAGTFECSVSRPHPGWSEQDPKEWITATSNSIEQLRSQFPKEIAAVKGIGFSGQMHGATLLDNSGEVLRPCILWNDTRSFAEAKKLDDDPKFRSISGNIVFPGFTAPKLAWVKNNEAGVFNKVAKVLLPKDYLRFWLTGETVSEMSDAAGTSWLDTAKRAWSDELLDASGMSREQMPSLVEGSEVSGYLKPELAKQWGMTGRVAVAGGAGDNAASAIGMGAVKKGAAFVSLGTSGVLFAANDEYLPNPESAVHAFCHAVPDTWHQMGVILSATDSLNWLSGVLRQSPGALTEALGDALKEPSVVTFLPYLSGERTPHNDAGVRGLFHGIDHASDSITLTQSVLEGVAFALKDNLLALNKAGTNLDRVTAVGGGSRSKLWLKIIATTLGIPVDVPVDGDFGAAFGAARLGLIAADNADPSSVCSPPKIQETIDPETHLQPLFEDAHKKYQRLYQAIHSIPS